MKTKMGEINSKYRYLFSKHEDYNITINRGITSTDTFKYDVVKSTTVVFLFHIC